MRATYFLFVALAVGSVLHAQSDGGFDEEVAAMTYHNVSRDPLDTRVIATRSQAAMRATNFDRPDVVVAEQAHLDAQLAAMDPAHEFTITIDDRITDYDRTSGQFSIELFTPGFYIPFQAFGQEYRIVFANAAAARAIAMPLVDALTATAVADRDVSDLGGNRLQNVVVSLQLIDAAWAAKFGG